MSGIARSAPQPQLLIRLATLEEERSFVQRHGPVGGTAEGGDVDGVGGFDAAADVECCLGVDGEEGEWELGQCEGRKREEGEK